MNAWHVPAAGDPVAGLVVVVTREAWGPLTE